MAESLKDKLKGALAKSGRFIEMGLRPQGKAVAAPAPPSPAPAGELEQGTDAIAENIRRKNAELKR